MFGTREVLTGDVGKALVNLAEAEDLERIHALLPSGGCAAPAVGLEKPKRLAPTSPRPTTESVDLSRYAP